MLAVLFIIGTLCALHQAAIDISLMEDGVLTARFPNTFLLRYPNCSAYGNKTAKILYQELSSSNNETKSFVVPSCNDTRDFPFFFLTNLKNGTTYSMWYEIDGNISSKLTNKTTTVRDFGVINDGLAGRSGAMVVITVILVLAIMALLAGLIFILFLSG